MRTFAWIALVLAGCNEYRINEEPPVKPADPPGVDPNEFGAPPDWNNCFVGWHGQYSNLSVDDPDVEPDPKAPPPAGWDGLTWWDSTSFERFDPTLDFGENWWPVDDGLEADPAYFAVHWRAWIRAFSGTDLQFLLGAADDAWLTVDGEEVVGLPGVHPFDPLTYTVHLDAGQYPIELRYAHRAGTSGFRYRTLSGDVKICYPDYTSDNETAQ